MSAAPAGARELAAAVLAALLLASPLHAESLYVIEQLVVAVASAPDPAAERVATIKSGDRVEVIERSGEQVHVRLPGGREGWVRAAYLSADEPLRTRLAQRDTDIARLTEEVSALKAQLSHDASPPTAIVGASATPGTALAPAAPAEEPGGAASVGLFGGNEERPPLLWPWTLAAGLIGFGMGFGLGALMLDRHIRRKFGGLRIY